MRYMLCIFVLIWVASTSAWGGEADVLAVDIKKTGGNFYDFSVTVRHADEGWNHYADRWEVVAPNGDVLATRVLAHPHEDEQPFTRSLGNVQIPAGIRRVTVRAHDSLHEYGGREVTVAVPR